MRGAALRVGLKGSAAAFLQPPVHIVVVELLAPQHAGQGLAHDIGLVRGEPRRNNGSVERVGFLAARLQRRFERRPEWTGPFAVGLGQGSWRHITEPQAHDLGCTGVDGQAVMRCRLGPLLRGVHCLCLAVDNVVVDAVLDVGAVVGDSEETLRVGVVFREQQRHVPCTVEPAVAQSGIAGLHDAHPRGASDLLQPRPVGLALPGPLVAVPQRRQDMHLRRFWTAVVNGDLDQDILRGGFGVLDEHVKVAILIEHAGIDQLILEVLPAQAAIGLDQVRRMGRPPADTYRGTSCRNGSACCRGRSNTP